MLIQIYVQIIRNVVKFVRGVCRLGKELDDLKKRRAAIRASLKTQAPETSRAVQSGE